MENGAIENSDVPSNSGQVCWSTFSDRRLKYSIQESELGLNFIISLKLGSYEYKAPSQAGIGYTSLIAQDVEKTLRKLNQEFNGIVKIKNRNDYNAFRYGDFVASLINSITEKQIIQLKSDNEILLRGIGRKNKVILKSN
jgi:hypothetical protein